MDMIVWLRNRMRATDRRQHARFYDRPMQMDIDGKRYQTLDWSLGGFRIAGYHAPLRPGQRVGGRIDSGDGIVSGDFAAEVVRLTDAGEVGLRFIEVSPATFLSMAGVRGC